MDSLKRIFQSFNGTLLFSCGVIALSQVNFGFEQAAFSGTQAMTAFTKQFGKYDEDTESWAIEPYFLSLLNSLTYIGFMFGLLSGNTISHRFGRRMCMFVMCVWALIAATILVTSQSKAQILVGRILAYIYIGMELAIVPIFQSEIVPGEVRGFVVGTYQTASLTGQLIMSGICRGTSSIESNASWRIPLGLIYVLPTVVGICLWFTPESPRWLLMKGRESDALESLKSLRRGAFTEEYISNEFEDMKNTINLTTERGHLKEAFKGTNTKRTFIAIGAAVFMQITGQNFVYTYGTIFLKSINAVDPFTMTSINNAISVVICVATMILSDKWGRRPLLIAGAIVQTGALLTMGGLGTPTNPSYSLKVGITAMVTIFVSGYTLGWAPLSHVVQAEVPTLRLRDATYALSSALNIIIQFAISFSLPYLLYAPYANLGSKVGFIFGSFAFCAIIFSVFCVPECRGLSLEEVDRLFLERVPIRLFGKTRARDTEDKLQADEIAAKEDKGVTQIQLEEASTEGR